MEGRARQAGRQGKASKVIASRKRELLLLIQPGVPKLQTRESRSPKTQETPLTAVCWMSLAPPCIYSEYAGTLELRCL